MKTSTIRAYIATLTVLLLGSVAPSPRAIGGELDVDLYGGFGMGAQIPGSSIDDLRSDPRFPDEPTLTSARGEVPPLMGGIQWPQPFEEINSAEQYGLQVQGYLQVPATGEWTFFIRSDDNSHFELNPDGADPDGAEVVAREPDCCNPFMDDGVRSSEPIELEKGNEYYFRALLKEDVGQDWLQVGWDGPTIDGPVVVGSRFVQRFVAEPGEPRITEQPEGVTAPEGEEIVFSVAVDALPPVDYQWQRDGEPIEGAVNAFLVREASFEDDGANFTVEVSNASGTVTSDPATLTLQPDEEPPRLISARGSGRLGGIVVEFSEAVAEASATNVGNYTIEGQDVTINGARLTEESMVVLEVTEYTGQPMRVRVGNVRDRSRAENEIEPGSEVFVSLDSTLRAYFPLDEGEGAEAADVAGGHKGALEGDPRWSTDVPSMGERENSFALQFDGSDDFVRTDFPGIAGSNPRTVSLWVKTTDTTDHGLVSWGNIAQGEKYHLRVNSTAGETQGKIRTEVQGGFKVGATDIADNQWHHIISRLPDVESPSNANVDHYINGELDASLTGADHPINTQVIGSPLSPPTTMPFAIGRRSQGESLAGGSSIDGVIDDVAVFNIALDEEQITALASGQSPVDLAESLSAPLSITRQPGSQSVSELRSVTFEVEVSGGDPATIEYQWFRDGEPIPGAIDPALILDPVTLDDNGTAFAVEAFNSDGSFNRVASEEAILSVQEDVEAPEIVDIQAFAGGVSRVSIRFDEGLDPSTATDAQNYEIEGLTVEGASLSADGQTVELATSPQAVGQEYTLVISGVTDAVSEENVTTTEITFESAISYSREVLVDGPVRYWRLGETAGVDALSAVSGDDALDTAHGTYSGSPALGVGSLVPSEPEDTAVSFEPGQHLDIPNGGDINVGGPYLEKTIEMWIRPAEIAGSDQAQGLWEQGATARGLGLYVIENEVFLNAWNNIDDGDGSPWGSGTTGGDPVFVGGGDLQAGETAHIVGVMDGVADNSLDGTLALYVNGRLVDETNGVGQLFNHGGDVDVGEAADLTHTEAEAVNFNGTIDEVSHYNEALSDSRVAAHFEAAFAEVFEFGPVAIIDSPESLTVTERREAVFTLELNGTPPFEVVWTKDGEPLKSETTTAKRPGLTFQTELEDDGSVITAEVSNAEGTDTSAEATLTVEADDQPPQVTAINAVNGRVNEIRITFDEPVAEASATDTASYSIPGLEVTEAELLSDGRTVVLRTSAQAVDQEISVQINGVTDRAAAGNPASTETQAESGLSYPAEILLDDPIRYWRFEETEGETAFSEVTGTAEAAVANADYTPEGTDITPDLDVPGLVAPSVSGAAEFNAENEHRIAFENHADINTADEAYITKTVELWFRADELPIDLEGVSPQKQYLYEHGGIGRGLSIYLSGTQSESPSEAEIVFHAWNPEDADEPTGGWGGEEDPVMVRAPIQAGEVYHAVMVLEGDDSGSNEGTLAGYLNGEEAGVASRVGELFPHGGLGGIGAVNRNTLAHDGVLDPAAFGGLFFFGNFFGGVLDEVALYNSALSPDQVTAHYEAGLFDVEPDGGQPTRLDLALAGGQVTLTWQGEATLETATSVAGPWEASDQESPASFSIEESNALFFRLIQ